jgi:predicted oxidoreductase
MLNTHKDSLRYDAGDFAYGTWRILDEKIPTTVEELAERLNSCLECGITTLDTAEIYGGYLVEESLGKVLKSHQELREGFKVVTKAGIDVPSDEKKHATLPHYNASSKNLVTCAEKSLQLLGVDAIDLFLIHRPDWLSSPEDTAAGLQQLLDEGKVKNVGVSNYSIHKFETLDQLMDGKLATNQVEFSPLEMAPLYDGTFDQCQQKKIRAMAWSPLGGGVLFRDQEGAAKRLRDKLTELSPKYGDAPIDVLVYAWIMATPANPTIILGTNKLDRILDGAKGATIQLDRQDWYGIWEAAKGQSVP